MYFEIRNSEEIVELLNFGFNYYETKFEIPFQFPKYDQVFGPEFHYSGMENPGAVLLTESYLFLENNSTKSRNT